jgi:hypothetical protein
MLSRPTSVQQRAVQDERGSVMVVVAVWLGVALLFTIFVVDVGNWFEHQRHLQVQADAAAFAGGSQFQACFGGGAGNSAVFQQASRYAGVDGSWNGTSFPDPTPRIPRLNLQIGGANHGAVAAFYQSKTYPPPGGPPADDTQTTGPCTAPNMFDVKMTEAHLPLFFGGFGLPSVTVHARARVQLFADAGLQPSIPLSPPDTNFSTVVVTFLNKTTGLELAGCTAGAGAVFVSGCTFKLAAGGSCLAAAGLKVECGAVNLPIAANVLTTMRVGAGSTASSCVGNGTATLKCFDANAPIALYAIRGYGTSLATNGAGTGHFVYSVKPATLCTGGSSSPFFSDYNTTTTCSGSVTALIDAGEVPPATGNLTASLSSGGGNAAMTRVCTVITNPLCFDNTRNAWYWATTASAFSIQTGFGVDTITIKKGNTTEATQQFYSGGLDSDPVKMVQVTDPATGFQATSLQAGGSLKTVNVNVGFATYVVNTPCSSAGGNSGKNYRCASDPTVLLRNQAGGSNSNHFSIDCGPGAQKDQFLNGCTTAYQIHPSPYTPICDPVTPADCAQSQTGCAVGNVDAPMSTRFGDTPNNYPNYSTDPPDPRLIVMVLTDFNSWNFQGTQNVPVVAFAAFYVTGWDRASGTQVSTNEPYPSPGSTPGCGDVWGHFVKFVDSTGTPSTNPCDPASPTPCVPTLTK